MGNYLKNKILARTKTVRPSLTDQSQVNDTDINKIVPRFLASGTLPGAPKPPMYGDFTEAPTTLRQALHLVKRARFLQDKLPEQLKGMSVDQLTRLTNDEIKAKLAPPAEPPAPKE